MTEVDLFPRTPPARPRPLVITPELLARARGVTRPTARRPLVEARRVFEPAAPPPGVIPSGEQSHGVAMDAAIEAFGWAAGQSLNNAVVEGSAWLGYAYLSELAVRPEYRAAVETIGEEMTREWIELKSTSTEDKTEQLKELNQALDQLNAQEVFAKAVEHDGFFGRGHIYLDTGATDDREELKTNLGNGRNSVSRGKVCPEHPLLALRNVEPIWTYPTQYDSNNPLKADWYRPNTWHVQGTEVHRSRLLTFIGHEVPDLLKPAYSFGGLSLSQMGLPYVNNWLNTRQSVADIIQAFSVMILETDMASTLQMGGQALFDRLELFNLLRNNAGVMAINHDTEEFKNVSAPLGGLDALQAQTQEHMAAIWKIPLVKLLGIQPAGLNASSEDEIRVFYDMIAAFQKKLLRRNLQTIIWFVMLSLWGKVDPTITFDFKPLWQLDEAALAAVQKTRADVHDTYVAMGAIGPETVRKAVAADPDSPYQGLDLDAEPPPTQGFENEETGEGGQHGQHEHPEDPENHFASSVTNRAASLGGVTSGV